MTKVWRTKIIGSLRNIRPVSTWCNCKRSSLAFYSRVRTRASNIMKRFDNQNASLITVSPRLRALRTRHPSPSHRNQPPLTNVGVYSLRSRAPVRLLVIRWYLRRPWHNVVFYAARVAVKSVAPYGQSKSLSELSCPRLNLNKYCNIAIFYPKAKPGKSSHSQNP